MNAFRRLVLLFAVSWAFTEGRADSHYAAQNGQTPASPYTDWSTAASNIQDAVNAAVANDTVLVGAGRYTAPANAVVDNGTNVVYLNKVLTLRSSNGVPESTIIDGGGNNRGILVQRFGSISPYQMVIDGFTITNCIATNHGAGVCWSLPDVMRTMDSAIRNCIIAGNRAAGNGGGIFGNNTQSLYPFNWTMSNTVVTGNAGRGVFHNSVGTLRMTDCRIENNQDGGIYLKETQTQTATVERCVIRNNVNAGGDGGGVFMSRGTHEFRNCLISGNSVGGTGYGGAMFIDGTGAVTTTVTMANCTVVSNSAPAGRTAGIQADAAFPKTWLDASNTIIYANYRVDGRLMNTNGPGMFTLNNCCIMPVSATVGANNITNDPLFVDVAGANFHLSGSSPCLNAGSNQTWMSGGVDLEGKPRIDAGTGLVDMGCYEYVYPAGTLIMTR